MAKKEEPETTAAPKAPTAPKESRKNARLENLRERLPEVLGKDDPGLIAQIQSR